MVFGSKKSQGLSINIIIVAAIVLVVLIVLWVIFSGRMGGFSSGLDKCKNECKTLTDCKADGGIKGVGNCEGGITSTGGIEILLGENEVVCCIQLN
ncbi:MAG: hypothetical protein ABIC04_08920 [Nanoarchaeota archaeon]